MTKIFISHSNNDSEFALQLAHALIEKGIDVWIDKSDIRVGKIWWDEIQRGLDECDTMILIISADAMASRNVADEWGYYLDEGKQIFPTRWLPAKIHFRLRGLQYIDFHERKFALALAELLMELQRQGVTFNDSNGEMHEIRSDYRPRQDYTFATHSVDYILPSPFEWVKIPGGQVRIEDAKDRGGTEESVYNIPDFGISKYPITNAQYQVFVDALDGYINTYWWRFSAHAKQWREENPKSPKPYFPGYDIPRTTVTWYDAVAFCCWLSASTNLDITLPTEQEWQRAAVGDTGWKYPWGNEFDMDKGHLFRSAYVPTYKTAVTEYPQGASIYGVMDMIGNTYEWCLNKWGSENADLLTNANRVVKGGSTVAFGVGSGNTGVKVNDRFGQSPLTSDFNTGFRIVIHSEI